jgi:hypothetical protein
MAVKAQLGMSAHGGASLSRLTRRGDVRAFVRVSERMPQPTGLVGALVD